MLEMRYLFSIRMFDSLLIMFNDDEVTIESVGGWAVDIFALDQEPYFVPLDVYKAKKSRTKIPSFFGFLCLYTQVHKTKFD